MSGDVASSPLMYASSSPVRGTAQSSGVFRPDNAATPRSGELRFVQIIILFGGGQG